MTFKWDKPKAIHLSLEYGTCRHTFSTETRLREWLAKHYPNAEIVPYKSESYRKRGAKVRLNDKPWGMIRITEFMG